MKKEPAKLLRQLALMTRETRKDLRRQWEQIPARDKPLALVKLRKSVKDAKQAFLDRYKLVQKNAGR